MGCPDAAVANAVPLTVLVQRRDICRQCPHATRSPDPRFAVNKGLTNKSECRKVTRGRPANIKNGTANGVRRCPVGKWEAFPPT